MSLTLLDEQAREQYDDMLQLGGDPWLVVLDLEFFDVDGDLAEGQVQVFMHGQLAFASQLEELFHQRGLSLHATSGRLPVAVRVDPSGDVAESGGTVELPLGVVLRDGGGHVSECGDLDVSIHFDP